MKSIIGMGELITEAHNSRDCSSLLLVAYKIKKKKLNKKPQPNKHQKTKDTQIKN